MAQAGNALALFAILLLLVNTGLLFTPIIPPAPPSPGVAPSRRVLLVVIDGLRADAVTPARMPHTFALAQRGFLKTGVVSALIPSTIAGVRGLVEGVTVPPAEFVYDFRSRQAASGGLVEAVNTAGGQVFVAGPYLWSDLYGRWLGGHLTVLGLARDDPTVLRAVRGACSDPHRKLLIAHFCRPDVTAHLHGATSPQYEESIAWCDRAVGELLRAAGENTLVVITSDHGVTRAGGHAGAEPDVLNTPLVASAPSLGSGLPDTIPQTHIPHLLAAALGIQLPVPTPRPASWFPIPATLLTVVGALIGGFALLHLLGSATRLPPPRDTAFWLNVSVWACLCLAWFDPWAAGGGALAVILTFGRPFRGKYPHVLNLALVTGLLLGALRIAVPWLTAGAGAPAQPSVFAIAGICLAAFAIGYSAGRILRPQGIGHLIWLGTGMIVIAPALSGFLSESVSLSTLDVRLAFRLIESPAGLAGAIIMGALRPFLPILFLLAGVVVYWSHTAEAPEVIVPLSVGIGAAIAGELTISAVILASTTSPPLAALALGLLLRECTLVAMLFPLLAGAATLLHRKSSRNNPPSLDTATSNGYAETGNSTQVF